MTKKIILVLLAVILAVSMVAAGAGCKKEEEVEIHWAVIPYGPNFVDSVIALADMYMEEHPNVTIIIDEYPHEDYIPKMVSLLAANQMPDIFYTFSAVTNQLGAEKLTLDLSDILYSEDREKYNIQAEDIDPAILSVATTETGEIVMLPRSMDVVMMFYNKDMFDEAGLDYPSNDWTYDDMVSYAKALTMETEDGMQYGLTTIPDFALAGAVAEGFVPDALSGENQTEWNFNTPEAVKGLGYYLNGYVEDYVMPIEATNEAGGWMNAFSIGRAAMAPLARWAVPLLRDNLEDDWDVVRMPKGSTGKHSAIFGTAGYSISATTEYADLCADILLSMYTEEGMSLFVSDYSLIPPIKSLYDSDIWRGLPGPPYNLDAFIDAADDAFDVPKVPYFSNPYFAEKIVDVINNMEAGMSLQEALDIAVEDFNANTADLKASLE